MCSKAPPSAPEGHSNMAFFCPNASLTSKDQLPREFQVHSQAMPSAPDLPKGSAKCLHCCWSPDTSHSLLQALIPNHRRRSCEIAPSNIPLQSSCLPLLFPSVYCCYGSIPEFALLGLQTALPYQVGTQPPTGGNAARRALCPGRCSRHIQACWRWYLG